VLACYGFSCAVKKKLICDEDLKIGLSRAVKTRLMKKLEMDRVGNHW
jgi:hypothetical protein